MTAIRRFMCLSIVSFAVTIPLLAQTAPTQKAPPGAKMMQFKADNAFVIREIGAVITEEKGIMKIIMIPPKDRLPQDMQSSDLAIGDEVGMAGGKRIRTMKELREAYDNAPVGGEFKIGVRREGQAHIATFVKKSEKDMPQGMRMMIRKEAPGGDENSDTFPALGIGIEKKGGEVFISEVMSHAPKGLKKGDIVKTLNGKEIKSIKDFNEVFDATAIGGELNLGLSRGGEAVKVTAIRPEPRGPVIMRKN